MRILFTRSRRLCAVLSAPLLLLACAGGGETGRGGGGYGGDGGGDTTPPLVAFEAPASGAAVAGTILVSGTADDDVGVAQVELCVDSAACQRATGTARWTYSLDTGALSNGSHTLTARAADAAGNVGSATRTVDVGASGGGGTCTHPLFITSDTNGGWDDGGYYVHNNMWNASSYPVTETLYACAHDSWYVVANAHDSGDGAVKTYPNVHKDYDDVPISTLFTLTSRFAATSPHVGIYNVAYDIWLNGVAEDGCTELMIWTENYNQVPAGSKVAAVTLGGRTYDVWRDPSGWQYVAFVPTAVTTSGTIDIKEILEWMVGRGWIPSNSTLGQLCFGVEIVSTGGKDATFTFTDFSIDSGIVGAAQAVEAGR